MKSAASCEKLIQVNAEVFATKSSRYSDASRQCGAESSTDLENIVAKQANITDLERRHQSLEDEIAEALLHSSTDDLKIADLKRRRLHLKDEIQRLRQETASDGR